MFSFCRSLPIVAAPNRSFFVDLLRIFVDLIHIFVNCYIWVLFCSSLRWFCCVGS
ncbi:hypothetical protein Tsubulata_045137 [Turnera subulata]|uniref:Uncharacterized protein n=1 Tax=Turnera subulata TaxID=218843 RepID=A0A9Q0F5K9_9ROSI|nr:hypothetical protein Tsubulata_045137 [Turnera subulata]